MQVTVLFFGMLKDVTGTPGQQIELPEAASLGSVWDYFAERHPRLRDLKTHVRLALNREFSDLDARVSSGDEIAFLPPVSGGSNSLNALTRQPIETRDIIARVQRAEDGAVVTFEGVVRNNTKGRSTEYLEYECYEAMALRMIDDLARDLKSRYAIGEIAIVHRLGRLAVGEASVVIAVSAPHRRPAFEAALEAINRLKATVPIWKKEHFADGEVWVDGEWDAAVSHDTVAG